MTGDGRNTKEVQSGFPGGRGRLAQETAGRSRKLPWTSDQRGHLANWVDAEKRRHSAATVAIEQGVALSVGQEMLGHFDIRVTRKYTHATSA